MKAILQTCLTRGLPLNPMPEPRPLNPAYPHAPKRVPHLSVAETKLAIKNALRYFPQDVHAILAPEFMEELKLYGHVYMYRFRPTEYEMKAYSIDDYPAQCYQAKSVQLMIMNNLHAHVAQFPEELITYGGNGGVFQNWAQYHITMKLLSEMTEQQTLHLYSGHPHGLFPSSIHAPRVVVTNGLFVSNYSSPAHYDKFYGLGVSQYGQMTAGSFCYIGPQGIVHGTTLVVLNAGRKYLGAKSNEDMRGKVFVTSGLGGMSGAQGKAGRICGCVTVIAEIDRAPLMKRFNQGWVDEVCDTLDSCIARIKAARVNKEAVSIAFHGNAVDLWERLADEEELLVDLGSDQTSLHNPFNGGYFPSGLTFEESKEMMASNPAEFKTRVQKSLLRQMDAINRLSARGMRFWDYGNALLLNASRAGADVFAADGISFKYPTYIQEFLGDIFSLGFGPFRWVCTSGDHSDLQRTDAIAAKVIRRLQQDAPPRVYDQLSDNLYWIEQAEQNQLVVGSEARILYADSKARVEIALAINEAIRDGHLKGPVVLSRDHHDVSGTDSPYRETSNVTDGSMFCADMSTHNCIGDSFRGATLVALHNGGGVGVGESQNGGFLLVLDGSAQADERARSMLFFDVNNGVTRRAWAGNDNALFAIKREMERTPNLKVTLPVQADESLLDSLM